MINPSGTLPADNITAGKVKNGIRAESVYLSNDTTVMIKNSVVSNFAKGATL